MLIAIVSFRLPEPLTLEEATTAFEGSATLYAGKPGLVRKYYFVTPAGDRAGGIYFWRSMFDAESCYNETWRATVAQKYGSDPELVYVQSPLSVDNVSGRIEHI